MAGAAYGLLLGVSMAALTAMWPGGAGWAIFFAVAAVQLTAGAVVVWRRTALVVMTGAFAWGAAASAAFAILAAGGVPTDALLRQHPFVVGPVLAVPPMLMFSEKWLHPVHWQRFKAASERVSLLDMLRFRHIPDLRPRTPLRADFL